MENNTLLSLHYLHHTKENYEKMCQRMKVILGCQDVWDIIDKGYTKTINEETLFQNEKDVLMKTRKNDQHTFMINILSCLPLMFK